MIDAGTLLSELAHRDVTEVTGVPCSYLTPLINRVASDPAIGYVPATHEGEAVAIATGAWLAGRTTCVIGQNSGLGNMINPLTSLNHPSRIPVPMIVTWRGEPGQPDEPQHELLGTIMPQLLELTLVERTALTTGTGEPAATLDRGWAAMARSELPFAFILRKGLVADEALDEPAPSKPSVSTVARHGGDGLLPRRIDALECLLEELPEPAAVVSTTGKTSRELFTLGDRPQHFYLVGAMGSASAVGLGLARHTERPVVVVDGDGAALMRMGTSATVAAYAGDNFVHVLLDNWVHDSTGGQLTLAPQVDFPAVAAACGYAQVHECGDLRGFAAALGTALVGPGPSLVYLRISSGSLAGLGRPDAHPSDVARRFRDFVTGAAA